MNMARVSVGDIMTRDFVSVPASENVLECIKKFVKYKVNSLLVIDSKKLVGILTSTDVFRETIKGKIINLSKVRAIDVATKKVAVIKPSADIYQALLKMKELNFRRLPVLTNGRLIGVITLKDILKIAPELYSDLGELAFVREEEQKLKKLEKPWLMEGFCEECGAFSDLLKVEEKLLCLDCREELY